MKILRTLLVLGLLAQLPAALAQPPAATPPSEGVTDLTGLLAPPAIWPADLAALPAAQPRIGLAWLSETTHDTLRAADPSGAALRYAGLPVLELLIRARDNHPAALTLSLYNRGDAGDLDKNRFAALLQTTTDALTAHLGSPPQPLPGDPAAPVRLEGRLWTTPAALLRLQWSFTREVKTRDIPFRAEFLRLEIIPPPATAQAGSAPAPATPATNQPHTPRRDPNGDVWLDTIPMVDQGDKGYCVVAATERILRYFGRDADQHELAQIAGSDANQGTDPAALIAALKKLTARLRIKVRTHYDIDYRAFTALLDDYNRFAKRAKQPAIEIGSGDISLDQIYLRMDPALLGQARASSKGDITRFRNDIVRCVDKAVPPLWSVMLGIVPETDLNAPPGSGHMRLIIGYNPKTDEILYSDTWGPGHEKKRMTLANAWTITTSLASLEAF